MRRAYFALPPRRRQALEKSVEIRIAMRQRMDPLTHGETGQVLLDRPTLIEEPQRVERAHQPPGGDLSSGNARSATKSSKPSRCTCPPLERPKSVSMTCTASHPSCFARATRANWRRMRARRIAGERFDHRARSTPPDSTDSGSIVGRPTIATFCIYRGPRVRDSRAIWTIVRSPLSLEKSRSSSRRR